LARLARRNPLSPREDAMWFAHLAGVLIAGVVTLTDATGAILPAVGTQITLTCGTSAPRIALADSSGAFRFADVSRGHCSITTDLQGFAPITAVADVQSTETLTLHLKAVPVRSGLLVSGASPPMTARQSCLKRCGR
jgi:hypothetical protein